MVVFASVEGPVHLIKNSFIYTITFFHGMKWVGECLFCYVGHL
jgi:hypothetical protein